MWLALFTFFSSEGRPVLNTAGQTITYNVNLDDNAILKIVYYCRKIASLREARICVCVINQLMTSGLFFKTC